MGNLNVAFTKEYNSASETKGTPTHATMYINLEVFMISEITLSQNDKNMWIHLHEVSTELKDRK